MSSVQSKSAGRRRNWLAEGRFFFLISRPCQLRKVKAQQGVKARQGDHASQEGPSWPDYTICMLKEPNDREQISLCACGGEERKVFPHPLLEADAGGIPHHLTPSWLKVSKGAGHPA